MEVDEMSELDREPVEGGPLPAARPAAPHLGLTKEEMTWAAIAHASIVLTVILGLASGGIAGIIGIAIPALIWLAYRDKSAYVVDQARQATIFQVAGILALLVLVIGGVLLLVVGWVITALLTVAIVGLILIPLMIILTLLFVVAIVGLPIAQLVYGCYAAFEAYHGRHFRYRWIGDLADRYIAHG
jgi:uncharacterized Tic20 family protein